MHRINSSVLTACRLVLLAIVQCIICDTVAGAVTGDLEALPLVAERLRANRDALRTWRGQATIYNQSRIGSDEPANNQQIDVEFVLDLQRDALRWRSVVQGDGVLRRELNGMLKEGAFYHMNPWDPDVDHDVRRRLNIQTPEYGSPKRSQFANFDPMYYANGENTSDRVAILEFMFAHAAEYQGPFSVSRNGDLVTVELAMPEHKIHYREVYDLAKGGSLVELYNQSREGMARHHFEYEQQKGLWVPTKALHEQEITAGHAAGRTLRRVVIWRENEINSTTPDAEFSFDAMGLRTGDVVFDERTGMHYRYQ